MEAPIISIHHTLSQLPIPGPFLTMNTFEES